MTSKRTPFRAGGEPVAVAPHLFAAGPSVLLADVSEFQSNIADAVYLTWSKAVVIRACYGAYHDDRAWYGGLRRSLLHAGGARFIGIYAYLVAGQPGAAQAQAFRALVGDIQPGEVLIADFEEGNRQLLDEWRAEMLTLYGESLSPYLWTYTGLNFGQAEGVLPVDWIAAYGQAEPVSPHRLWQFTSAFPVPGVGTCDCSIFHGTIDELAALAFQPSKPVPPPVPAPQPQPLSLEEIVALAPTVRSGSTGQPVKNWQGLLKARGYDLGTSGPGRDGIDGSFETVTDKATRAFQKAHGLAVDGVAGPMSLRAALTS